MARKPRIEFDDAFYHVIARGNQRQRTFQDDQDRSNYIELIDSGPRRGDPLRPRRVSIGISEIYASQPRTLTGTRKPLALSLEQPRGLSPETSFGQDRHASCAQPTQLTSRSGQKGLSEVHGRGCKTGARGEVLSNPRPAFLGDEEFVQEIAQRAEAKEVDIRGKTVGFARLLQAMGRVHKSFCYRRDGSA